MNLDPIKFQETIDIIESEREFKSEQHLWEAVCKTEWAKNQERPLTPPTARSYARSLNLTFKTKSITKLGKKRIVRTSEGKGRTWTYRLTLKYETSQDFKIRTYKTDKKIRNNEDISEIEEKLNAKVICFAKMDG